MTDRLRAAAQAALEALEFDGFTPDDTTHRRCVTEAVVGLRAALAEPDGVQGWKLVPLTPTEEMLAATSWPGCAATDYAHMLSAAPAPPRREPSDGPHLHRNRE